MTSSPIGVAWSNTYPNSDRSCEVSKRLAPSRPISSATVNRSSRPTGEPSTTQRRAIVRIIATADLLSAPRMPACAFSQPSSISTGSIGAVGGTVSRCAHSRTVRSDRPRTRASRLPASSRCDLEPHALQLGGDARGARRLLPRRAGDAAELREELTLPGLLPLAGRSHRCPDRPGPGRAARSGGAAAWRVADRRGEVPRRDPARIGGRVRVGIAGLTGPRPALRRRSPAAAAPSSAPAPRPRTRGTAAPGAPAAT